MTILAALPVFSEASDGSCLSSLRKAIECFEGALSDVPSFVTLKNAVFTALSKEE